jgi:hypothetical protein
MVCSALPRAREYRTLPRGQDAFADDGGGLAGSSGSRCPTARTVYGCPGRSPAGQKSTRHGQLHLKLGMAGGAAAAERPISSEKFGGFESGCGPTAPALCFMLYKAAAPLAVGLPWSVPTARRRRDPRARTRKSAPPFAGLGCLRPVERRRTGRSAGHFASVAPQLH